MLTLSEFRTLANATGIQVTWNQAKPPQQTRMVNRAIFQATKRENTEIVNAYGLNGVSIQVAATDLPLAPEKFDAFTTAAGDRHVVDLVVPHKERGTGAIISYTMYCKGKG